VGVVVPRITPSRELLLGVLGVALAAAFLVVGRANLVRPYVALPAVWFLAVAVAQLPVIDYRSPWSTDMVILAFGAPLAFAVASWAAAGDLPKPTVAPRPQPNYGRLGPAGAVLLAAGMVGVTVKAALLGGVPILSPNIDELRSAGGVAVPFYVSYLVVCSTFSTWVWSWRWAQRRQLHDAALALWSLALVASGGSRNVLLVAVVVPLVYMYLSGLFAAIGWRRIAVVGAVLLAIASGLFFLRLGQQRDSQFGSYVYSSVVERSPTVLRPLLPVYIGLATPLETLNRVTAYRRPNDGSDPGQYSVPGVPPVLNPFGARRDFYALTGALSQPYYFNVATFVGPLYADGGLALALVLAAVVGFLAGALFRVLYRSGTVASVALAAYGTYVVTFLFYENLLTFYTLQVPWDALVIWATLRYVTQNQPAPPRTTVSGGGARRG
jgi:oligosaccharide repeat unit polymerase